MTVGVTVGVMVGPGPGVGIGPGPGVGPIIKKRVSSAGKGIEPPLVFDASSELMRGADHLRRPEDRSLFSILSIGLR